MIYSPSFFIHGSTTFSSSIQCSAFPASHPPFPAPFPVSCCPQCFYPSVPLSGVYFLWESQCGLPKATSKHLLSSREWDFQRELGFVCLRPLPEEEKGPVKFLLCPVSSLPQVGLLFILSLGMRCFPISVNPVPSVFWGLCNPGWIFGCLQH